jgi:lysophospholipase L1-like esterase
MQLPRYACMIALLAAAACAAQQPHWVGTWSSSQQKPEPTDFVTSADLKDATLRQIVHLSLSGQQLRIHLSNRFGTQPLHISAAHIARPLSPPKPVIDPASDHALTFGGAPDVTIPAGAEYLSDPIAYPATPLADVAITLQLTNPPSIQTGHSGSRATSYLAHRVALNSPDLAGAKPFDHWLFLSAIDVLATPQAFAIVTLGDSITDGHGATTNGNDRWPDLLSARLQSSGTKHIGILNQGIGGNRLLNDGLGPNLLSRLDPDVLAQTGVRAVIVLEGVNDLGTASRLAELTPEGHAALTQQIITAYGQIIRQAHAHGIAVIGATITPYTGSDYYHPSPASEAERQTINAWIRSPHHFDTVIDFDKAIADPAHPDHLLPIYDSGDHLHPSPAGYKAMANAIQLPALLPQIRKP